MLHLVDCSLLVPPQPGPDGRPRYAMLETLRAFGLDRLAEAGEQPEAAAGLAGFVAGQAAQQAAGQAWNPARKSRPLPAGWTPKTPPSSRP